MTQKNLLIALITLIVAIFVFAQVYILFAVSQVNQSIVQLETRMDKRFAEVNQRIEGLRSEMNQRLSDVDANIRQLNQNYQNHLAHHIGEGEKP